MSDSKLWFEFITKDGLCGLCLNAGWLMILDSKQEHRMVKRYCICPNGRALKERKVGGLDE